MDEVLTPDWADPDLSTALPGMCAKGEGQSLEFKLQLPAQGHDIGKSIASFASTNDGRLIYGVSDAGKIVGLSEATDAKARDVIKQRILSAAKEIKPAVHPNIRWACTDGKPVCVVTVEKGADALYYSNQRPIVRRDATSRPAEPGEVEQIYRERYANRRGTVGPATQLIGMRIQQVLALMNVNRSQQFSVVDLARAMDMPTPADLEAIVEGYAPASFAMVDLFCTRFAVDKAWLTSGRGEPFQSPLEHHPLPEDYLARIEEASPDCVYLVRAGSDAGESFIVVQEDPLKAWCVPDVWHVSSQVGGAGSRALLSLYDLFQRWRNGNKRYRLLGRHVEPEFAEAIYGGAAFPGILEIQPISHWWDDLTDIAHKWTSREGSKKNYGKQFVAAQDIIREMVAKSRR